jgi:hypothetical protein
MTELQEAIDAAYEALRNVGIPGGDPAREVASVAVRAAWPHAEGLLGNMRARNFRQREANARMQRQVEDLKASARDQAAKLRAADAELRSWRLLGQALVDIWPELPRDHEDAVRFIGAEAATLRARVAELEHALAGRSRRDFAVEAAAAQRWADDGGAHHGC